MVRKSCKMGFLICSDSDGFTHAAFSWWNVLYCLTKVANVLQFGDVGNFSPIPNYVASNPKILLRSLIWFRAFTVKLLTRFKTIRPFDINIKNPTELLKNPVTLFERIHPPNVHCKISRNKNTPVKCKAHKLCLESTNQYSLHHQIIMT